MIVATVSEFISGFTVLPAYGIGALLVLLLYAVQSEIRFGSRARRMRPGPSDRRSTLLVSVSSAIPVLGFVLVMKESAPPVSIMLPQWFRRAVIPGLPSVAWVGVALGICGLALRLWAVLTLRDRYTRTLLVQDEHSVERGGPYRWVRHPGYLGSLLCLNGIALASGNSVTLLASLVATLGAYNYRIRVEDAMLVAAFGDCYDEYRQQVRALVPSFRSTRLASRSGLDA
jgi:protein-S-isoprenylcysteine O-methyltransferase Ste14